MKAGVENKISKSVLALLMIITAIVLVLFYFVGFDNTVMLKSGVKTDPENLDALMIWMYALLAVGALSVVVMGVMQLLSDLKGALKGLLYVAVFAAVFGIAFSLADTAPVMKSGKAHTDEFDLIISDVCIYVQYFLLTATTVLTIISLTGVTKFFNKVKE